MDNMMQVTKKVRFIVLLFFALLLTFLAVMAPVLAPHDPNKVNLPKKLHSPDRENLLGTDQLGRDILSRIMYGARDSFAMTLFVVLITACIGTAIGIAAGFTGGAIDTVCMQIADVLLAFPSVVFVIAIISVWGSGISNTLIAIAMISWAKYARISRGLSIEIRSYEYITMAILGGARWRRILWRYLVPNILPHIIIIATQDVGETMITLSTLSFLGLVGKPSAPEWGNMLANSRAYIVTYPYVVLFPCLAILVIIIIFSLLGDSLRDVLDPKDKR